MRKGGKRKYEVRGREREEKRDDYKERRVV
jgi:hypothetical protein